MTANLKELREALEAVLKKTENVSGNPICPCCFVQRWNRAEHKSDCAIRRAASVLSQMETPAPQSGGSPVGDDDTA